jgi:hypothetical protein
MLIIWAQLVGGFLYMQMAGQSAMEKVAGDLKQIAFKRMLKGDGVAE